MAGTITVTIDAEGESKVEVKGVAGKSCKDLTKGIESALGVVTSTENTREFEQRSESRRAVEQ